MSRPAPASAPAPAAYSLRRRLLLLLLAVSVLLWLATIAAAFLRAHSLADDIFDAHLQQTARLLLATEPGSGHVDVQPAPAAAGGDVLFQIWRRSPEGLVLALHSSGAGGPPLSAAEGFTETAWRGGEWRFYSEWSGDGQRQVQVAQSHDIRYALAQEAAMRLLAPLILGLPLLAAALWVALGRGLQPLARIAGQLDRRLPDSPLPLGSGPVPEEVAPLVQALDGLFARIARLLDNERQFTASAAHELRTPLAALKIQAQVALRADEGEVRQRALLNVLEGVERLGRLVEQLLTLARLDPAANTALGPLDPRPLAREICALLAPAAQARGVSLELQQDDSGVAPLLAGNADLLRILLRNLVDNAVRYTRSGGHVWVSLGREDGRILLTVADDGPGIPEAAREQALGRFTRLEPGRAEGSGLGLSIVARVAELHRAALSLGVGPAGTGLRVLVVFPALAG
ncbi:MAG TPA: ATP-binding protein [Azospira sp.]|nr:ATP-binding protein [Azospira sp.]